MTKGIFHSFRFQLLFVLALGVAAPVLLAVGIPSTGQIYTGTFLNSLVMVAAAAVILVCAIRRFALFPGTGVAPYILPTLAAIYAVFISFIMVFRIEYSVKIMVFGFLGTLVARYAVATLNVRGPQQIYYIVPGGRAKSVSQLMPLSSVMLNAPTAPEIPHAAIIADLHHEHSPEWERFLAEAAISGIPVYHYKQAWESITGQVHIEHLSENGFGALIPSLPYRKIKRAADILLCILVMPAALAILLAAAAMIKLDSPGPVFFCQKRMGYRGRVFLMFKLRTMSITHNGDDRLASMTHSDDERITRAGAFLRRTRIDELPQIFNILRGEMSWIGPRPETVSLSEWYEREIPFYRYRHIVRPGITGWAQVNQGHVFSIDDTDSKLKYDFFYIKNISYWIDIFILFKTVKVILQGTGVK